MIDFKTLKPGDLIRNDILDEIKLIISISYDYTDHGGENVYNVVWIDDYYDIIPIRFNDVYAYRFSKIN